MRSSNGKPIFQGVSVENIALIVQGKYIAYCEGDDF